MVGIDDIYWTKAVESLAGANGELANALYNNCANRCYYSCFQAAIAALFRVGIRPAGEWSHAFVQARFAGELIGRRKAYPSDLRDVLARLLFLRHLADYKTQVISEAQASRAVRRAAWFIEAITIKEARQ